jgi:prepilin-type N-terminal cleavage/methylation domain-containing protein
VLKRRSFKVSELVHQYAPGSSRTGFTLLELLVTCVIAGVIIAITGKGLSAAYSGNSRSSATRMVSTTLFQARAVAIQRSRQSWLVRSGNTIKILGDSLGTQVQVGKTLDLAQRYSVTLGSVATPNAGDTTISFDSRGLITGSVTSLKIIVTKGSTADTVCVTGLGNTRARGC